MSRHDSTADEQLLEIIEAWSRIGDLPGYALKRHGFDDSNGRFGITYPEDLDEYQREVGTSRGLSSNVSVRFFMKTSTALGQKYAFTSLESCRTSA